MSTPKILFVDLETSPNSVFAWGLWDQRIALNQIIETSGILCFSAKWAGKKEVIFDSVYKSSRKSMLKKVHALLSEADIVVTYNGIAFDLPVLNREFLVAGMSPPAPHKNVDLLRTARKQFRFASNKMDHIVQQLGIGAKASHEGFGLWVKCMNGDAAAWKRMEKYNKKDTVLTEKLYERLLPWIPGHVNMGNYSDKAVCTNCGSGKLQRRGTAVNASGRYARYQCECGAWMRGATKVAPKNSKRLVAA